MIRHCFPPGCIPDLVPFSHRTDSKNTKSLTFSTLDLVDVVTNSLFGGRAMALKTMSGYPQCCSKIAKLSTSGMIWAVLGQAMHDKIGRNHTQLDHMTKP